jgi:hypothetical protein
MSTAGFSLKGYFLIAFVECLSTVFLPVGTEISATVMLLLFGVFKQKYESFSPRGLKLCLF